MLGWAVVWVRTQAALQQLVDEAPKAKWYYSDGFDAYDRLWYHFGRYEVSEGKSDTYSVEADNAELRHYLARWLASLVVFLVARMLCVVPYVYLFSASTADNFTNNVIPTILLISWTSLAHYFRHSLIYDFILPIESMMILSEASSHHVPVSCGSIIAFILFWIRMPAIALF